MRAGGRGWRHTVDLVSPGEGEAIFLARYMNPAEVFPSAIGRGPWSLNSTVKIKDRQDDGGGLATGGESELSTLVRPRQGEMNGTSQPAAGGGGGGRDRKRRTRQPAGSTIE